MPTNRDKWYVGPLPVFKAFIGETQVYPAKLVGSDGVLYEEEDAHIFVANGNTINLPCVGLPTYVSVNGVNVTPTSLTTRTIEVEEIGEDGVATTTSEEVQVASITANDGDIIHAIFDWDNESNVRQDWFSDILQFGLNSKTGKRNQLCCGPWAFSHMKANPTIITNLDISNLTNMSWMFRDSTFNQPIGEWDTSNVTEMYQMFYNDTSFNQPIGEWDVSRVKDMSSMFFKSWSFNQDISKWDVSNVTKMNYMFQETPFNQDISKWDVSNVTNMRYMFNASPFNQPIGNWDVSSVQKMGYMFCDAKSFNQDLSQWCVINVDTYGGFDEGADAWTLPKPVWGTCPSEDYDIVEATKYCVAKVIVGKVYPAFHKDDGRPVVATQGHPAGGTAVWEMKDGLPVGEPTGYDWYPADVVESADYTYKTLSRAQTRDVRSFIDTHTISQTNSVPYDDGRDSAPDLIANYKSMGDLKEAKWGFYGGDDNFVARFLPPNNPWYPGAYVYYLCGQYERNSDWSYHIFQNGEGMGEGSWIFISETPLFDWEHQQLPEDVQ